MRTELQMVSHVSPRVAAVSLPLAAWLLFPQLLLTPGKESILLFLLHLSSYLFPRGGCLPGCFGRILCLPLSLQADIATWWL